LGRTGLAEDADLIHGAHEADVSFLDGEDLRDMIKNLDAEQSSVCAATLIGDYSSKGLGESGLGGIGEPFEQASAGD
jgi:hypothetical protein